MLLSNVNIAVIFPFLGAEIGGSHISTLILAEELRRCGSFDCVFLCPEGTSLQKEIARRGFRSVASGELAAGAWSAFEDFARWRPRRAVLAEILAAPNCVVHCNDMPSLRSWLLPAKSLWLPVIYHHRSLNRISAAKHVLLACTDHIICTSSATARNLSFVGESRRSLICNPFEAVSGALDRQACAQKLRAELGFDAEQLIVGFVGNFWKRKRPDLFIEVAAKMHSRLPQLHFVLYGRAGDIPADALKARARALGLGDAVSFLGFRSPPSANLAAIDLLLALAIDEPFGRTLIEAALLGTPYVATNDAGHREILARWGGGIAAPKSASSAELAAISLSALNRRHSIALDSARRTAIAEELSPRRHAERVVSIYGKQLRKNASRLRGHALQSARAQS